MVVLYVRTSLPQALQRFLYGSHQGFFTEGPPGLLNRCGISADPQKHRQNFSTEAVTIVLQKQKLHLGFSIEAPSELLFGSHQRFST